MTGNSDLDWDDLGRLWRADTPAPLQLTALRDRVQAQKRIMLLTICLEAGLFAGLAIFSAWYAGDGLTPAKAVALAVVWALNAVFEAFTVVNRRGTWRAERETTSAYVQLLVRRARAKSRVARLVPLGAALQAAAVLFMVWADRGSLAIGKALAVTTVVVAAYAAWAAWYARRTRAELAQALAIQERMSDEGADVR